MTQQQGGRVLIFKDRLSKMQNAAANAMAGWTPGGIQVPDSVYLAHVQAEMAESQSSGNLMITRTFTIVEGEFTGLRIWDHITLEQSSQDDDTIKVPNTMGLTQARRWVEIYGIPWPEEDLSQIEEAVLQINEAAPICKIRSKKTKDRKDPTGQNFFTNVTVMEVVSYGGELPIVNESTQETTSEENQSAPENTQAETANEPDLLDSMNRAQLKQHLVNKDLEGSIHVTIKWTDDDIRNAIRTALAETPGEPESIQETTPEENQSATESNYDANTLLAFCASQQISEVEDGMEIEQLTNIMKGYQFTREELTEEEITMLDVIGCGANIISKPAPLSPSVPAKTVTPKMPVKPVTPKMPGLPPKMPVKPPVLPAQAKLPPKMPGLPTKTGTGKPVMPAPGVKLPSKMPGKK